MEQKIPAVSVIIPMYNAEKFIGACLESIFAQTFKDFEIIVVDDCSTDKSCKIIENYLKRGGAQLKLLRSKKNFGNPCVPRNKGLNISRGKYIYFMDDDDLVVDNALEKLYNYAENYNVDVIHMHKYFRFDVNSENHFPDKNTLKIAATCNEELLEPVFVSDNMAERMIDHLNFKIHVMPWLKFSRRDFLIENEINFPNIKTGEDDLWTMKILCKAKKILRIPDAFYIWRMNPDSLTRSKKVGAEKIKYIMNFSIIGMKFMAEFFHEEKFFQENPQYWYAWASRMVQGGFKIIFPELANVQPHEVFKIFYEQFAQDTGENAELISYLCSMINSQQKQLYLANQKISELERRLAGN